MTNKHAIEYHSFIINRKNGGHIVTGIKDKNITALKIMRIIYDGEDFEKGHVFRLLMSNFIKGHHHIGKTGDSKPYTLLCFTDEAGEWYSGDNDWDWEVTDTNISTGDILDRFVCKCWIDNSLMKDVNITIEVKIQVA